MNRIDFTDVSVTAPGAQAQILRSVNASLTERRVAVIGDNGSGKSTLARLVNGLMTATTGQVTVDGLDPSRDGHAVRRKAGFVFTQPQAQLVMPTALEDVCLSLRRHIRNRTHREAEAMRILRRFNLEAHAHTSVHALSGGQQQLLALAGVLAIEPEIVLADEPTTLLDLRNSRAIADLLLSLDQQVVVVTHDLELAARCDRVLHIEDGRVYSDGPADTVIAGYRQRAASR